MLRRLTFIALLIVVAAAATGRSQELHSVEGLVIDQTTRKPVSNATVRIGKDSSFCTTDEKGEFTISELSRGTYELRVSHVGYREVIRPLSLAGSSVGKLRIFLEPEAIPVDGITVTATRFSEDEFSLPVAVSITPYDEFLERSSSTTAELLREEPGILVQKTAHGHGAPILRGLIGRHVLLLYDGIRLNRSTYRFGANQYLNTFDQATLGKIEVVRGPSSVLYGSDAIGGTVNLIPIVLPRTHDTFSITPTVLSRYSSADNGRSMHLRLNGGYHRVSSFLGTTYKKTGNLRAGHREGLQEPTGWEEVSWSTRISYGAGQNSDFTLDYLAVRQNVVPRYDKYASGDFTMYLYDPQDRDLVGVTFHGKMLNSVIHSLKCNLSYQVETEGRVEQKTGSPTVTRSRDKISTRGGYIQLSSFIHQEHWLSFGLEHYIEKISSSKCQITAAGAEEIRPTFPDNSKYRSTGLFVQDQHSVRDDLRATIGLRYSIINLSSPLEQPFGLVDETYSDLTGSAALSYSLNSAANMILRWSQGFMAPNLNDVAVLKYSSSGVDAPSIGLKPERCNSYELGLKMQGADCGGNLFFFYSQLSDLTDRKPGFYDGKSFFDENGNGLKDSNEFDIFQRRNVGRSRIYGVEFDNVVSIGESWETRTNLFWTWGENQTDHEPLSRIPPIMAMAALRLRFGRTSWFEVYARAAGSQRRLSSRDRDDTRIDENGTPSWATINVRSGIDISGMTLNLGLENIADATYKEHGSGVYSPGRNLVLALRIDGL